MPVYSVHHGGKRLADVKARDLDCAYAAAATENDLRPYDLTVVDATEFEQNPNDLEALARTLTSNGAWTLLETVRSPNTIDASYLGGSGRIYTGMGKWTCLAATGVFNGLRAKGLAEERVGGWNHTGYGVSRCFTGYHVTPLGAKVAAYLLAHYGATGELLSRED